MAVTNPIDTALMARRLADAVRIMPSAREIRFRLDRGVARLWLITDPIDLDTEEHFYAVSQCLYDEFPGKLIDFQVINPSWFSPFDPATIVPSGFESIQIHAQP